MTNPSPHFGGTKGIPQVANRRMLPQRFQFPAKTLTHAIIYDDMVMDISHITNEELHDLETVS